MKHIALVALALALTACAAHSGNTDPEVFRAEYDAVSAVTGMPPLAEISCVAVPDVELKRMCSDRGLPVCNALISDGVIYFDADAPTRPEGRCERSDKTGQPFARTMIHELLHVAGYDHGKQMTYTAYDVWSEFYRPVYCSELEERARQAN